MEPRPLIYRYWGKAAKEDDRCHLLLYHSLDVAAVGDQLLSRSPGLSHHLAELAGMDQHTFQRWMVFFLSHHDIGKFADSFQNLRPDILYTLQSRKSDRNYAQRHDSLGYQFWQDCLKKIFVETGLLKNSKARQPSREKQCMDYWWRAVTGHHGQPPASLKNYVARDVCELPQDQQAIKKFSRRIQALLLKGQIAFPLDDIDAASRSSWWLAGFTVLCDWLGSSRSSEEFSCSVTSLEKYWEQAREWAAQVIERSEILPAKPAEVFEYSSLFAAKQHEIEFTPLQQQAMAIPFDDKPQLLILEDVTGAGKTEAAMILLRQLMKAGAANGFYFALPTMATANAMYERMSSLYRDLFSSELAPSLVLAHSASRLNEHYRETLRDYVSEEKHLNGDGTDTASAHCSQWLSDNRKKALLAEVGVGTIDQALLAILPSRHQSLRMLGLLGKVLIVDEVHACDAYMNTLLCRLLTAHSMSGGSVILLSATLPFQQRQQLCDAFRAGLTDRLGRPAEALRKTSQTDYPLLTRVGDSMLEETVVATRASVKRTVKVEMLNQQDELMAKIARSLEQGRCVCWIRNTVNDARQALKLFQTVYPQFEATLFHARFAMGDRLQIEQEVLEKFGPKSNTKTRCGKLLIATQVVEQSLDLDFDLMVTDLAPIDLMIQRAGRLCRHARDRAGNRSNAGDKRGTPKLIIYTPEWQGNPDENWLKSALPGTAAVYEKMDGQLWLGMKRLRDTGQFRMPDDARMLIECVYGEQAGDHLPPGLENLSLQQQAEYLSQKGQGRMIALNLDLGYDRREQYIWWDEANTPTRLGEASTTIYLARWENGHLTPWRNSAAHQWANSAVKLMSQYINQSVQPDDISTALLDDTRSQLPSQGKFGVLLVLRPFEEQLWKGQAKNLQDEIVDIFYHEESGLMLERDREQQTAPGVSP